MSELKIPFFSQFEKYEGAENPNFSQFGKYEGSENPNVFSIWEI